MRKTAKKKKRESGKNFFSFFVSNLFEANKLDGLLSKLDHRQLRTLLKQAIDQEIDLTEPIRNYMNVNRAAFGVWNPRMKKEEKEAKNKRKEIKRKGRQKEAETKRKRQKD